MIKKILKRHKCYGNYFPNIEEPLRDRESLQKEIEGLENKLQEKWKNDIGDRWYGFSIGLAPKEWFYVIDEFLDYLKETVAELEIHQIKMKFGGIRFYVNFVCGDEADAEFIELQIAELERRLFCKKLIF